MSPLRTSRRVHAVGAACAALVALAACDATLGDSESQLPADASAPGTPDAPVGDTPDAEPPAIDAAPPPDAQPCVEGDDRVVGASTGHCYFYYATTVTWPQARSACQAEGAHLVVSTSQTENDDFSPLAGQLDVWVGGSDVDDEALWIWVTMEAMGYTNWRTGEPNNGNGEYEEDCMIIEGDNGGLWDDRPCDASYGYICERE